MESYAKFEYILCFYDVIKIKLFYYTSWLMNKWADMESIRMKIVLEVLMVLTPTETPYIHICIDMSNTEFIEVLCVFTGRNYRLISADLVARLI